MLNQYDILRETVCYVKISMGLGLGMVPILL